MTLMEKAEALGKALSESSEYGELKKAENTMQGDEDAQSLLNEFQSLQKRAQMAQSNGQQVTAEQQKELQATQAKMQANEKIKAYMEAQQKFNKVMESVNQVITDHLKGDEEQNPNK
jgi:cell fate (sporulation/competence/biofilm development) regulator YlbF (YheA/YmcA/DUF963 family)